MVTFLFGENDFERTQALKGLKASHSDARHVDGATLDRERLADVLSGQTLFSTGELHIIEDLSANTSLWQELPAWLERAGESANVVLAETKPDKRTATFKWLKKHVDAQELPALTPRDTGRIEAWVKTEAARLGVSLFSSQARLLVQRVGLDQWQLHQALQKVRLLDTVTDDGIRSITDARPDENVFALFETALRGDTTELSAMLTSLRQTEEPYRVFGLLTGQVMQLAALALGQLSNRNVAQDLGASPYMLSKLAPLASRLSTEQVRNVIELASKADNRLKTSATDPWLVIEHMLISFANV